MTQPRELIALITRLRKSGQPLKQVRLLLKLWQAVEDVPRRERFRLLRHLGLEGGEQLVAEFLSGGGHLDPKTAATGVRLLDSIPPSRLRAFTSRHLSPEETGEIVEMLRRLLVGQAGGALQEREPAPPAPPPSEEPHIRRSSRRVEPPPEEPAEEPLEAAEDYEDDVRNIASEVIRTAAAGLAGVAAAKAAEKDREKTAEPDEAREAEPAPAGTKSPEPEPEPAVEPIEEEPPGPEPPLPPPLAETPEPVIVPPPPTRQTAPEIAHLAPAEWLTGIKAQATPTSRLMAFTRLEEQLTEVSPTDARSLVALFPAGWMRRRVLQRLFSAGLLSSSDATQMVTELEATPVTYLWLAGALLDSADTNADQRQTLIDNAPSATIRRLLEARNRA